MDAVAAPESGRSTLTLKAIWTATWRAVNVRAVKRAETHMSFFPPGLTKDRLWQCFPIDG